MPLKYFLHSQIHRLKYFLLPQICKPVEVHKQFFEIFQAIYLQDNKYIQKEPTKTLLTRRYSQMTGQTLVDQKKLIYLTLFQKYKDLEIKRINLDLNLIKKFQIEEKSKVLQGSNQLKLLLKL